MDTTDPMKEEKGNGGEGALIEERRGDSCSSSRAIEYLTKSQFQERVMSFGVVGH